MAARAPAPLGRSGLLLLGLALAVRVAYAFAADTTLTSLLICH